MLCDKCGKNNATTHIKQIINGVVTERNLCSSCAAEEGYSKFPHGGLADMLASMFGDISGLGTEADETCCPEMCIRDRCNAVLNFRNPF